MSYYDLTDEQAKRMAVDYNFCACLEYNPQPFNLFDVERVLAVVEGENDGPDWHWVVQLKDGRFAYLQGGCDYTGWDCQSSADTAFYATAEEAARGSVGRGEISIEIQGSLLAQLEQGKIETWREKQDKTFGLRAA